MSDIATQIVSSNASPEVSAPDTSVDQSTAPVNDQSSDEVEGQKPEVDTDFSARFAALSKREKALLDQQNRIKEEAEKYKKYQDLESKAKENPLSVLEAMGLDLDAIIAASLGEDAPPKSVEEQLADLKAEIENERKRKEEDEKKAKEDEEKALQTQYDEAIEAHKTDIKMFLEDNKEKYELINFQSADDLVWDVTEAHYDTNGEVLPIEKAAEMVEEYLTAQYQKALELKKFKPEEKKEEVDFFKTETPVNPFVQANKPKTLTSDLNSTPTDRDTEYLTEEESKRRAAAMLKWT